MIKYRIQHTLLVIGIPIVSFISGIIVRQLFIKKPKKEEILGTLRIDNSDPDQPNALFLELGVPVEYISSKKIIHLQVLNENYLRK